MAQAGIRYFSTAPNFFDASATSSSLDQQALLVGLALGNQRVLVWIPPGICPVDLIHHLSDKYGNDYQAELDSRAVSLRHRHLPGAARR